MSHEDLLVTQLRNVLHTFRTATQQLPAVERPEAMERYAGIVKFSSQELELMCEGLELLYYLRWLLERARTVRLALTPLIALPTVLVKQQDGNEFLHNSDTLVQALRDAVAAMDDTATLPEHGGEKDVELDQLVSAPGLEVRMRSSGAGT